ncbi:hypothetical protein J2X87_000669 [Pseudomonas synxantha]|uniref:Uncharacterized protein n=1 Tax=Pseudomonas synxantha TaxID=47883 RepID=A0ACC6JGF9_9PSED|nr:hypothetical protein [Pseudomonas synxantha]
MVATWDCFVFLHDISKNNSWILDIEGDGAPLPRKEEALRARHAIIFRPRNDLHQDSPSPVSGDDNHKQICWINMERTAHYSYNAIH